MAPVGPPSGRPWPSTPGPWPLAPGPSAEKSTLPLRLTLTRTPSAALGAALGAAACSLLPAPRSLLVSFLGVSARKASKRGDLLEILPESWRGVNGVNGVSGVNGVGGVGGVSGVGGGE